MKIPGMEEAEADLLFKEGFKSVSAVASADPDMLKTIPGISEEKAVEWVQKAGQIMDQQVSRESAPGRAEA